MSEANEVLGTNLTREHLSQLEQKKLTHGQKFLNFIVTLLPLLAYGIAMIEYLIIPDAYSNTDPEIYMYLLSIPAVVYAVCWIVSMFKLKAGNRKLYQKLLHKAPFYSVLFLLLAAYDYVTLKTGILMQPYLPWVNKIMNAAIADYAMLLKSTYHSLKLLFMGYFSGVFAGLVTGIACGYSKKVRYWVNPIIKVLGPIPTATWIPLIMILAASLFSGAVFIVALGTWFAVTVASMTGISNVDRSFYDAAKTLGAGRYQLVFNVAIPHALPSIFQGMTQGMSSACISLMIAEMMGVEAGLGWYITWAKAWANFDKMFAAIVVICITFNVVTIVLDKVKKRALRWQKEEVK